MGVRFTGSVLGLAVVLAKHGVCSKQPAARPKRWKPGEGNVPLLRNTRRSAVSAPLVAGLALFLTTSTAACRLRVPSADLAEQLTAARTADDYAALAGAFDAQADAYAADAAEHRRLAAAYAASGTLLWHRHHDRSELRFADHCSRTAEDLEAAAAELRALAREQEKVARVLQDERPKGGP